ncbi:adenylate/guanylate cyclase domain-containing protein [Maridesulfovibrio sp. FT414]|uniref:adenylate/guanylate cyclase domain-containing protein n=1 Tax=Maridesulfovibrio sp. FT414 TaxID=2979469 RepID=UPI003D8045CE
MSAAVLNFDIRVKARIIAQSAVCFALAVVLLAGGAYAFYHFKSTEAQRELRTQAVSDIDTARSLILAELEEPLSELLYLASLSEVTTAFTSVISPEHLSDLVSLSAIKKKYDKIRLIDRYGMEVVRINYDDGAPKVVPEKSLQFIGTQYYFPRINSLEKDQIYISPLDLNIEDGKVELPVKPVLRIARPLFDEKGKRRGAAVLNYFGELLYPYLDGINRSPGEQLFLLNKDGYYLYGGAPDDNWGFMFSERAGKKFQSLYPQEWQKMTTGASGQFSTPAGLFSFNTINLEDVALSSSAKIVSDAGSWKLVSVIPGNAVAAGMDTLFHDVMNFVLLLTAAAGVVSFAVGKLRMDNARGEIAVAEMTKSYERFVPREFLRLLNKERYRDITLESNVRKAMGILFSDIRSYTQISEQMEPEEVLSFLNRYFQGISQAIADNRGFVDSFHGDALLALFPETPDQAVRSAVGMRLHLNEFNREREEHEERQIEIGIGIHFGEVTLGTVGTTYRMQATVIGDAVNLAARIESVTKTFKIDIVVTGSALEMMESPESFHLREIDTVRVKGKEHPVVLYEVYDHNAPEIRKTKDELKPLMEQALKWYRKGDFQQALDIFKVCANACPEDSIPPIYIKRCSTFLRIPPGPGWTGVSPV